MRVVSSVVLVASAFLSVGCATTATEFNFAVPAITVDSDPVPFTRSRDEPNPGPKVTTPVTKTMKIRGSRGGGILIPVAFGDHVEKCILDTGSSGSMVMGTDFFKELPIAGRGWQTGVSGHWEAAFRVSAKRVTIGGRVWDDAVFTRVDSERAKPLGANCLIGMNMLAGSTLYFDFKNQRFQMLRGIPIGHPTSELFLSRTGDMEIPVEVGHQKLLAVWDCGAEMTLVDLQTVEAEPSAFVFWKTFPGSGTDITGRKFDVKAYEVKEFEIAGVRQRGPIHMAGMDLRMALNSHPAVLFGLDLADRSQWYFDLTRARWAME